MNETAARHQGTAPSSFNRRTRYALLFGWLAFIWIASTDEFSAGNTSRFIRPLLRWFFPKRSEAELDVLHFLVRKAAHFLEYAILALLASRAFAISSQRLIRKRWFELALLLIVFNSLLDELHQSFVPSRTGTIYDSMIDVAGGLTALLIVWFYNRRQNSEANS